VGPILRSFDQPALKALLSDATGQNLVEWNELDDRSYDRFLRYPFVRQTKITRASSIAVQYTFHELVRQVSIAALHRHHLETAKRLHRNMAKYYWDIYWDDIKTGYEQEVADLEARMTPEDVAWFKKWPEQITRETSDEMFRALLEYFYHALQVKEFQIDAFERWMGLVRGAVYRWKQGRAPLLFQIVEQLRDENLLFLKGQEEPYSQYLVVYAQFLAQEARLDEARDVLREVTGLIEQREEPTELAASLASIGYTYSTLGELDLALKYYERTATLIKEGDTPKITAVLSNIGVIYLERNNPKKALDYFQQVLALGDIRDGEASLYRAYNIGRVLEEQGHLDEALDCYKASLTYISQESNLSLIARCLTQIGSIYRELGNFIEALDYYQKALEISQHIRDSVTTAACLNGIGLIHFYQGNAGKALQFYQQSLEISVELEFPRDLAAAHHNIADVYLSRRQYRRAAEQYDKALRLYERLGQGFESDVVEELERLAACNLALGEIEKTVNYKIRAQHPVIPLNMVCR
jgi:tetratricopeptide (TPR) repeat protein